MGLSFCPHRRNAVVEVRPGDAPRPARAARRNGRNGRIGMGTARMAGADLGLNYERVVTKPASEPYSQTVRLTVRQLW